MREEELRNVKILFTIIFDFSVILFLKHFSAIHHNVLLRDHDLAKESGGGTIIHFI